MIDQLSNDTSAGNISMTVIANYLFYRLLAANSDFLPKYKPANIELKQAELGRPRRRSAFQKIGSDPNMIYADPRVECAFESLKYLQYANARFYIDNLYPNSIARETIRK